MMDIEYNAGAAGPDNVMDSTSNYTRVRGAACKVGRAVVARYKEIDGEGFGNRAWAELEREQDTPANRQLLVYYTEQALKFLVKSQEIKSLIVEVGDAVGITGAALLVSFTDTRTGSTQTLSYISPWSDL
jgi:hypothetical protein